MKALALLLLAAIAQARRNLPRVKPDNDQNSPYNWTTAVFTTRLNHFSYVDTRTINIRYLYNLDHYKPGSPLFFYTGNEGDIEEFATATGLMWDLAPVFNAAIVLCEHRYYGHSLPFGNYTNTYSSTSNLEYFSTTQALGDFAAILTALKDQKKPLAIGFPKETKAENPSGTRPRERLRLKYPHLFDGVWASSAPVLYFRGGGVDYAEFDTISTETMAKSGCKNDIIAGSWEAHRRLAKTADGLKYLNDVFKVSPKSLITNDADVLSLNFFIREAIEYMAMVDYPMPAGFMKPLPSWPAKAGCEALMKEPATDDKGVASAMARLTEVYYNYANKSDYQACFKAGCGDPATAALGTPDGWPWQECTEIIIEMCSRGGAVDVFWDECGEIKNDTVAEMREGCQASFAARGWKDEMLMEMAVPTEYGLTFESATNMILTQGELDPWRAGGVRKGDKQRMVYVLNIKNSGHHLDLRQPNTCDPSNIASIRYQAVEIIKCWVEGKKCDIDLVDSDSVVPDYKECKDIFYQYPWGVTPGTVAPEATTMGHTALFPAFSLILTLVALAL